jgi:hypothetical protein
LMVASTVGFAEVCVGKTGLISSCEHRATKCTGTQAVALAPGRKKYYAPRGRVPNQGPKAYIPSEHQPVQRIVLPPGLTWIFKISSQCSLLGVQAEGIISASSPKLRYEQPCS